MEKVVIIGAVRTPIGKYNGRLKSLSEATLCGLTLRKVILETKLASEQLNEIVIGNSKQTSEPSNLARYAMLDADLPVNIPAYTVQRHNASGGQAIAKAYWSIKSGINEVILAGGAESMSQIPIEIQQSRFMFNGASDVIFEPIERQVEEAQPKGIYGVWGTEKLAEKLTEHYRVTTDEIEAHSLSCAEKSKKKKAFKRMFPVDVKLRKTTDRVVDDYQGDYQLIAAPADGAASLMITSETYAKAHNLSIIAEIVSLKQTAGHPIENGVVDIKGVQLVLEQAGMNIADLDVIDLAESSAAYGLGFRHELSKIGSMEALTGKINPYGSFLESGIPGGATSPIQCVNVLDYLEKKQRRHGLIITQCDGGQTMTLLIKRRGN